MAQTKKKRSRKHRGTPAGTVKRPARTSQPKSRAEAKKVSRDRRQERLDRVPTLKGAVTRAGIAAPLLTIFAVFALETPVTQALVLMVFMFALYIPLGYLTDRAVYNFRQKRKQS